jgi:release factor glutamine methyltransferase
MSDIDFDSDELVLAVEKRCSHYPLQYILGFWDFFRETYRVTEDTLIPRQDTEKLVELAINVMPEGARFIDLCTGSGCVAISTLASRPDCRGVAVDLFERTLAVATENAERNGVTDRLGFLRADVLNPSFMDSLGYFECILSNPPYIETAVCDRLDPRVKDHEPRLALDGGESGLDFFERYLADAINVLRPGGAVFFEIGEGQGEAVRRLMFEFGFEKISLEQDYSGHDRYVSGVLP